MGGSLASVVGTFQNVFSSIGFFLKLLIESFLKFSLPLVVAV